MADITVYSTDQANMRDYALWLQAPAGETALPYTVGDLRMLLAPSCPAAGVVGPDDFLVTSGASAGTVTVSAGVGVTSPAGISGAASRERYLFGADGPVDVPVYANVNTTARIHRLVAQVNDEQLAMGASSDPWSYRLLEDVGAGPPTGAGNNSVSLALITVNPGQASGYTISDARNPCGHALGCAIHKTSTFSMSVNSEVMVVWAGADTAGGGDPWHLYDNPSSSVKIRASGLYDLAFSTTFSGVTNAIASGIECFAEIRNNGAAIGFAQGKQIPSGQGPLQLRALVAGEYLSPGDTLTCHVSYLCGTATSVSITGGPCSLRVARCEYRP